MGSRTMTRVLPALLAALLSPVLMGGTLVRDVGVERGWHTSVALPNGKVLVVGGRSNGGWTDRVELFDPSTGRWRDAGQLARARSGLTATVLRNGKVLLLGGSDGTAWPLCELYEPLRSSWSQCKEMPSPRYVHTATLLQDGRVLVTGGLGSDGLPTATASLFDPAANTWSAAPSMHHTRSNHTATLLENGKVLVVGGFGTGPATLDLFDPALGWTMIEAAAFGGRMWHSATLLRNGRVLVVGGNNPATNENLAGAFLFEPSTKELLPVSPMPFPRSAHSATLLPNGELLVAGGYGTGGAPSTSLLLFRPGGTWEELGNLAVARAWNTALALTHGEVLVVGGFADVAPNLPLKSVELVLPFASAWSAAGALSQPRVGHTASLLPDGQVYFLGGGPTSSELHPGGSGAAAKAWPDSPPYGREGHTATLLLDGRLWVAGGKKHGAASSNTQLLDTRAPNAVVDGPGLLTGRMHHTATMLADGRVLVVGGEDAQGVPLASSELLNPVTLEQVPGPELTYARQGHTATLLPNGKVLVAGGSDGTAALDSVELFDASASAWFTGPPLGSPRARHAATLLPDGRLMVVGGHDAAALATAEAFDWVSGTWEPLESSDVTHDEATAVTLATGEVLLLGGTQTVERYHPALGVWRPVAPLAAPRARPSATVLLDGQVLVAGGGDSLGLERLSDARDRSAPLTLGASFPVALPFEVSFTFSGGPFSFTPEGVTGDYRSAAAPLSSLLLLRDESGQTVRLPVLELSGTQATATLPQGVPAGWYTVRLVAGGVRSEARRVRIGPMELLGGSGAGSAYPLGADLGGCVCQSASPLGGLAWLGVLWWLGRRRTPRAPPRA